MRAVIWLGALAIGCTSAAVGGPPVHTRDVLATPQAFTMVPASTTVELDASVDRGSSRETSHVIVPVTGGGAEVAADGDQLALRDLTIDLAPVDIPASIFSGGARLTELHLRLAAPATTANATWSDDDERGGGDVAVALELAWSIELDGKIYPLAPQRIDGIQLGLAVDRDGDRIVFDAGAIASGVRWSWADLVFFGDLTLTLHAQR